MKGYSIELGTLVLAGAINLVNEAFYNNPTPE